MRKVTLVSTVLFAALAIGPVPHGLRAALAQNTGDRAVSGTVLDDASHPVPGATVFLKDQKTKTIRSFTSIANGHFYFAQVNKVKDFDLWAEKDGKKSAVKTVSSWDARTEFISDLKLK
jgi:hypothetical protein